MKLFKAGTMCLHGGSDPDQVIRPNPDDAQLDAALKEGILCRVLEQGAYVGDVDGMLAIVAEDNLNASVEMSTNEMEILRWYAKEIGLMKGGNDPSPLSNKAAKQFLQRRAADQRYLRQRTYTRRAEKRGRASGKPRD